MSIRYDDDDNFVGSEDQWSSITYEDHDESSPWGTSNDETSKKSGGDSEQAYLNELLSAPRLSEEDEAKYFNDLAESRKEILRAYGDLLFRSGIPKEEALELLLSLFKAYLGDNKQGDQDQDDLDKKSDLDHLIEGKKTKKKALAAEVISLAKSVLELSDRILKAKIIEEEAPLSKKFRNSVLGILTGLENLELTWSQLNTDIVKPAIAKMRDSIQTLVWEREKNKLQVSEKEKFIRISLADINLAYQKASNIRNQIFLSNIRLVHKLASDIMKSHFRELQGNGIEKFDLVTAGSAGLLAAIDSFNPCIGCMLSTHAYWSIRSALADFIGNSVPGRVIPANVLSEIKKIFAVKARLSEELNREPSIEEIATEARMTPKKVNNLFVLWLFYESLDEPVLNEVNKESSRHEIYGDPNAVSPLEAALKSEQGEKVSEIVKKLLTTNQRDIYFMRFGIGFATGKSLEEIAKLNACSVENIRQIIARATKKLKSNEVLRELWGEQNTLSAMGGAKKKKAAGTPRKSSGPPGGSRKKGRSKILRQGVLSEPPEFP
jgi:RNA polymerase sigma factor (sigma-70 family)